MREISRGKSTPVLYDPGLLKEGLKIDLAELTRLRREQPKSHGIIDRYTIRGALLMISMSQRARRGQSIDPSEYGEIVKKVNRGEDVIKNSHWEGDSEEKIISL